MIPLYKKILLLTVMPCALSSIVVRAIPDDHKQQQAIVVDDDLWHWRLLYLAAQYTVQIGFLPAYAYLMKGTVLRQAPRSLTAFMGLVSGMISHPIPVISTSIPVALIGAALAIANVSPPGQQQSWNTDIIKLFGIAYGAANLGYFTSSFLLNKGLLSLVSFLNKDNWDLMPFRHQIYVVNKTGKPLTLLADTPCQDGETTWQMRYDVAATDQLQSFSLSDWRWDWATGPRFQREKLCFPRIKFPIDRRWLPYPDVEYIRFISQDCDNAKAESACVLDSCLLPIDPSLHIPVYIIEERQNKVLVVSLRYYGAEESRKIYTMKQPGWKDNLSYLASSIDYFFSQKNYLYFDGAATKTRVDPVRSCS